MNIGPRVDINATEIAKSTEKAAVAAVLVHPQPSNPLFVSELPNTNQTSSYWKRNHAGDSFNETDFI